MSSCLEPVLRRGGGDGGCLKMSVQGERGGPRPGTVGTLITKLGGACAQELTQKGYSRLDADDSQTLSTYWGLAHVPCRACWEYRGIVHRTPPLGFLFPHTYTDTQVGMTLVIGL